jgi:hypothetical protein
VQFDLGDNVPLRHTVYDSDGVPTAATVTLTFTKPSGDTLAATLATPSTGVYENAAFTTDETGLWSLLWSVSGTVTEVTSGSFAVGSPAPTPYVSLPDFREYLKISDTTRDAILTRAIRAASRSIDAMCGRHFYLDWAPTARTIRTRGQTYLDGADFALIVPDIAEASTVVVSGRTVTTDDPDSGQAIARLYSASPWPETKVVVTARWGWPAVPDDVEQAALILASRLYKRRDSPEGVLGSAEWGTIRVSRRDPDVGALLEPYIVHGIA